MNLYFLELLIKERQKEILADIERARISRAGPDRRAGILKKGNVAFGELLMGMGTRLRRKYRPVMQGMIIVHFNDRADLKKQHLNLINFKII